MADSSEPSYDTRPWAPAVNRALAFADEKGARIVGVTGDRAGVGVSLLAREFAHAYAQHGYKVILVDASRVDIAGPGRTERPAPPLDLQAMASDQGMGYSVVDLAVHAAHLPHEREAYKEAFERAIGPAFDVIVVDLPPVHADADESILALGVFGAACQIVYLLCLSGVISNPELHDCIESCKLAHVSIAGIIVNDWKLPMASLAANR